MSGLLKALPLTLTLTLSALIVFNASCSSGSGEALIRIVNAIPDSQPVDVYVNGTKIATNLPFGALQPDTIPASYVPVSAGSVTIQGFPTGTTVNPVAPNGTITLTNATEYTAVAIGLELDDSPPLLMVDTDTVPASGKVEFRVANASPSSPAAGVDVYFVPPGTDIANYTPQISGLADGQGSNYQSLTFLSGGYAMIVTETLKKVALISQTYTPQSASITTLVLVDNAGGNNGMSQTPLVLNDLN